MILHVSTLGTFIIPFLKLVDEQFPNQEHQFWLLEGQKLNQDLIEKGGNTFICKRSGIGRLYSYLRLIVMLHRARKIMLHGLFDPRVIILLAFCPWLLNKSYWVILGGDLYDYQKPKLQIIDKITESLRSFVIRRLGHLVTYIPGDVELARQWYGARGGYHECLMYLSNVVSPQVLNVEEHDGEQSSGLNILVGNSADPSNNHIEVLEKLLPYKEKDIKIFVPLSYGDQGHAKKVIVHGTDLFGDKFVPMTSFMPFEDYLVFLKSVDVAIFNHKRQQAMGNTITLLGLGKTVHMRDDVSHWDFLSGLGMNVNPIAGFNLNLLPERERLSNTRIVISYFSKEKLIDQLSNIFRS